MISKPFEQKIQRINNDSINGSTIIVLKIIDLIKQLLSEDLYFQISDIEKMLKKFINAHPTMAILVNFSNDLLFFLEQKEIRKKEDNKYIQIFLDQYTKTQTQLHQKIQEYFIKQFGTISSIATYSTSGTIRGCLEVLYDSNQQMKIYCAESRPKNEGALLARELSKKGIQTYLTTDASFFSQIEQYDVIVVGSDAITRNGVINKMGTYPLANLANTFDIPFYCVTSTNKLIPYGYSTPDQEQKDSHEIFSESGSHLNISNYYFDTTPIHLFSGYITELGLLDYTQIQSIIKEKRLHFSLK